MTGPSQNGSPPALETSVQVALRIRPVFSDPKNPVKRRADNEVLAVVERAASPGSDGSGHDQPQQIAIIPLQRHFTFDHVFGTSATQEEVYLGCVKRMVDRFMEGYNVTIMAYGQTSSGKTYTMGTASTSTENRGHPSEGIIPRAMAQLFNEAKKPPPVYPGYRIPPLKTVFRVSFVELYNEDLIDLLAKGDYRPQVTIREDTKGTIYWTGVQEIVVTSVEEIIHLLWYGSQNRQTHSTEMNEKSSRSHAIFSITLRQEKFVPTHPPPPVDPRRLHAKGPSTGNGAANGVATRPTTPTTPGSSIPAPFTSGIQVPGSKLRRQSALTETPSPSLLAASGSPDDPEPEGEWVVLSSKFHFVDLAGSERLKRTSAIGDRAKEGISINAGLHALGNVISALGDPSKKSSHVPYRDSKLTRLLQDSLGGNALALMIACVSPTELNLGETINTLKYANRARNIKNSSSLNQEVNMDNPEYLRSIIQKLKLEIKMLKEANAARGASGDVTPIPASESQKSPTSNRHSIASGSTMVQGSDDSTNEDRALSPSPSRKLHHYRSRDSISTDISHGYLDAVHEEDDRFSDTSSSARNTMDSLRFSSINGASPKQRPSLMPLTIPPSADSMASFQEFVEPVIEEYEKVIAGLENHLSRTQENLNTAELMLEERQGRIEVIEDENKVLLRQHEERKSQIAMIEDENRVLLQQQRERQASEAKNDALQQQQKELEQQLQKLQEQLIEVESRKAKSEEYAHELESKLQQEKEAAEERVRQALKEKELEVQSSRSLSPVPSNAAKEMELKQLADRILRLEEQYQHQQQETDAEADAIRSAQVAQGESSESAFESDGEREEREARETKREELLVEKLQSKAVLEQELEAEKARHEALLLEIKASKTPSVDEKDSIHTDEDVHDEGMIEHLGVSIPMHDEATNAFVKHLESELAHALEEIAILKEKLEQLQRDYGAALEMEEMLRAAVTELEERLKNSEETNALNLQRIQELEEQSTKAEQESKSSQEIYATNLLRIQELEERSTKAEQEVKSTQEVHATNLEKLEHSLQRIQELEERSTKAELESLKLVEELKVKLTGADSAAEARLADEMLDLLQEMDQERSKVKELQAQVENYLAALAAEKSRADELESDRDAIRSQWDADKSRIQVLEKKIEDLSTQALQNAELIASLEEMISQHEGTEATKLQLEQELSQRILEHDEALASKAALIQELEQRVQELELSLQSTESDAKEQVARAEDELSEALTMLMESQEKEQEQQKALQELQDKVAALDAEAAISRDALADKDNEYAEVLLALESKIKVAEADRDDAETRLEDAERRHEAVKEEMMSVKDEIKVKQTSIDEHLAAIELLQNKVTELQSQSLPSSRPLSASSSVGTLAASDDPGSVIQKLEQEKARYRALVRLNEKEIERLNQDLEALANDFMKAAADSEDAEDEMRARIAELEALVDERNSKPNNLSSTSLNRLQASSGSHQAQLTTLKAERDEALKSSEQLSAIVAELNEQNHTLQEKFFTLERDHESLKLQQVMESQAYQDEIRGLRERADRMDRNGSPSPVGGLHHLDDVERVLRHKASYSSEHRGEDSLATPRQSWNTTASTSQHANANAQGRPGRHESTLIQQAKYIKMLEEKVAELQGGSNGDGPKFTPLASAAALGLNIHHKSSDPELSRSVMQRHSAEKVSPAMRNLATFASGHAAPSTPPPTTPLPPPPSIATAPKNAPHPSASAAPPSPRIGSGPQLDVSPNSSPRLRPSRAGSNASRTMVSPSPNGAQSGRRERDSTSSNASESNNGWTSPAGSTAAGNSNISAATAQALQGVEVNELRGVVDTLAHQVQALKVDQTMQQGKIQRLEAALADAEERLKRAQGERDTITTEKDSLTKELEQLRAELASAKVKADKERATLESKIEREKKEREKVMEIHTLMEAKVEERISRKSKFRCI